jgi:hypothetical protein
MKSINPVFLIICLKFHFGFSLLLIRIQSFRILGDDISSKPRMLIPEYTSFLDSVVLAANRTKSKKT